MLFKIRSFFKFIFSSTNQHGVHSPFVYNLVTRCFYVNTNKDLFPEISELLKSGDNKPFSFKVAKLLNRLPNYLGYSKAFLPENLDTSINKIISLKNTTSIDNTLQSDTNYDLFFLDSKNIVDASEITTLFSHCHNDSVIILNGPYRSTDSQNIWNKIKDHPQVMVTIDCFSLGLIFLRKEQAKEHFTIRL